MADCLIRTLEGRINLNGNTCPHPEAFCQIDISGHACPANPCACQEVQPRYNDQPVMRKTVVDERVDSPGSEKASLDPTTKAMAAAL